MKKITALFASALISIMAFGQSGQELNNLVLESFKYFPRIKELNTATEVSELRVDVAQSNFLPNVNGVGSYTYLNPISEKEFPVGPNEMELLKFQPYNNYNLNLGVNQLLWDFGRSKAQVDKAKSDLLVSRLNTDAAKLQLAAQVASIYYSMIYLKKSIVVQDSAIVFYERNRGIIEGKIRQGDALQIDLTTMQNNVDQEKNRKLEFQRLFDRQIALMRYATGQEGQPGIDDLTFRSPIAVADLTGNPELMAASERITASQAEARAAERSKTPNLSLQAGAGFKNGYQPNIDAFRFNYLGGVTLNVPVFQGGRLQKNSVIARKSVALNEYAKANLATSLQKDLESVQSDIRAYEAQIVNSEGQISVAREALRLTQVRYRQGVVTYLDLINASTNLQRAFLARLQFEYQRTLANVELCRLGGVKFWE